MKQLICTLRDIYYSLDRKIKEYLKDYIKDAPSDNKIYGRKNNNWENIESQGIIDAPVDGKKYLRQDNQWVEETKVDTSDLVSKGELSKKLDISIYNTDKKSFALKTDLPDLENYVTKESADSIYAKKNEIPDISHLATKEEISDMETKSNATATYQPIGDYATNSQLQGKADVEELNKYLTKDTAEETYAKKGDVPTLPIASADTLGGIKVGAGLSINSETGVLNANGGGVADSVDWNNITSKPETFTPSSHNHSIADINTLQETLNNKADKSELSNKLDIDTYNTDKDTFSTKSDLQNKVDKEEGKSLVSDSEIAKLAELKNYDDTDIKSSISTLTETKADKTAISDMATQTWVESKGYLTEHQDISNLVTKTELSEGLESKQDKGDYALRESLNSKQDLLVSGVNIKTINGEPILGEGNMVVSSSKEASVLDLTEIPNVFTTTESTTISDGLYSKIQEAYNNGVKLCLIGDYGDTPTKTPLDIMYLEGGYFLNIEMSIFISGHYVKDTSLILVQSASSVSIIANTYLFPTSLDGSNNNISLVSDETILECSMKGYSKPLSYSAITTSDSIGKAIGKLEAGINLSQQSWNVFINLSDYIDVYEETHATGDIKNWEKLKPILEECSFHVNTSTVEINKKQLFIQLGFISAMRVDCSVSSGSYFITGSYVTGISGSSASVFYVTISIKDNGTTATFEVNSSVT